MQTNLVFLYNSMLSKYKEMNIPLKYICPAKIEAKLYWKYGKKDTFAIPHGNKRTYGSRFVYGAIFSLEDFDFYMRLIDSFLVCSKSILRVNHPKDVFHREILEVTPIKYNSLDDLSKLKYIEREPISCHLHLGNVENHKIKQQITKQIHIPRIECGVDKLHYKNFMEDTK